MQKLKYEHFLV